jgi:mannose-6-phosphate isomerase-like protein (cupin superfamily)
MFFVRGENLEIGRQKSGEHFRVLVGRHEKHGATKHHTVVMVELDPGVTSATHFHKEREESYFIVSGAGSATIGGETVSVQAGDLVYARPGEKHSFSNERALPLRYLVITAPSWIPEDSF